MKQAIRRGTAARFAAAMLGATALSLPMLAQAAPADEPQTAAAPAAEDDGGLQDIIVTAQKRSENLQKVPLSVVAVTAEDALIRGVTGTLALTAWCCQSNANSSPHDGVRSLNAAA